MRKRDVIEEQIMSDQPLDVRRTGDTASAADHADGLPGLARGLGWFSVALGIAELCAPRALSRVAGIDANATIVRLYGLREVVCGIGILASRQPQRFLWARVAGDVLDVGSTAAAAKTGHARAGRRTLAVGTALAGVGALDIYAARAAAASQSARRRASTGPLLDYSARSGFPQPPHVMRGAARVDFQIPRDMRTPEALRPYPTAAGTNGASGKNVADALGTSWK
jgi:hypothetical protein